MSTDLYTLSSFDVEQTPGREIDYGTVCGIAGAFGLVVIAIIIGGELTSFLDFSSALIVFGGTLGATFVNYPISEVLRSLDVVRTVIWPDTHSGLARLRYLVELSNRVRADGVLALEQIVGLEHDPFLRKGLQLIADGIPQEEVQRTLEIDLHHIVDRHRRGAQIFQSMANIAPAMGLIGTLIGLVHMLENLNDPSRIGPGMATALLTTFYGAVLSYMLFMPLAGKLRTRSDEELVLKEMTIEGLVGMMQQTNPRLLEQRLLGFLPPQERLSRYEA